MDRDTSHNSKGIVDNLKMDMPQENQHPIQFQDETNPLFRKKDSSTEGTVQVPLANAPARSTNGEMSSKDKSTKLYEDKERSRKPKVSANHAIDLTDAGTEGCSFSLNDSASSPKDLQQPDNLQSRMVVRALANSSLDEKLLADDASEKAKLTRPVTASSSCSLDDSTSSRRAALDCLMVESTCDENVPGFVPDSHMEGGEQHEPAEDDETSREVEAAETKRCKQPEEEETQLSIGEVKRMVFESLPESGREQFPPKTWDRIFNETDSMLSGDIVSLRRCHDAEDDVSDLISCISDKLQKQFKGSGSQSSQTSSFASATYPSVVHQETDMEPRAKTERAMDNPLAVPKELAALMAPGEGADVPKPKGIPSEVSVSGLKIKGPRVSFSNVHIRFYERFLSDNPSVSAGPAVGIGWKFKTMKNEVSVDEFEHLRSPFRRCCPEQLVLPRVERTFILFGAGFSKREVADSVRNILRVKNQRKQTFHNLPYQGMEEFMEKTARRVKRAATFSFCHVC
jgi:hypothetical protein